MWVHRFWESIWLHIDKIIMACFDKSMVLRLTIKLYRCIRSMYTTVKAKVKINVVLSSLNILSARNVWNMAMSVALYFCHYLLMDLLWIVSIMEGMTWVLDANTLNEIISNFQVISVWPCSYDHIINAPSKYLYNSAFNRRKLIMSWTGVLDCLWAFCDIISELFLFSHMLLFSM